jgi:hypothetical protein
VGTIQSGSPPGGPNAERRTPNGELLDRLAFFLSQLVVYSPHGRSTGYLRLSKLADPRFVRMAQQPSSIPRDRNWGRRHPDLCIARLSPVTRPVSSAGATQPEITGPAGAILLGDQQGSSSTRDALVRHCRCRWLVERKLVARILVIRLRLDRWMDECRSRYHGGQPIFERQYPLHQSRSMVRRDATKRHRSHQDADVQAFR